MSAFIIHPEHINVLIWTGLHHLRGGARLRWLFGNPTDVAELTAENATSVGRMLLEENTASVNHLHREHHDINTSYTYRQPSHTGWSLPELLNALHCYQLQAGEHPGWETGQAHAFCQAFVALGAADNVQQTRLAGPTYPHAHRVVTAVQRAHRWCQRDTVLRGGQRIPVGAHHDAFTATAPYPIPAVTVAADSALPDRTVLGARSAHHQRLERRQFLGVHPRIHQQP
jgi:hypothetical protein